MAPFRSRAGRLHPRRTSSNHQDLLRLRGRGDFCVRLLARPWIDEAGNGSVLKHGVKAALVAGHTVVYLIALPFSGLGKKVGICQKSSRHGHQIGLAIS